MFSILLFIMRVGGMDIEGTVHYCGISRHHNLCRFDPDVLGPSCQGGQARGITRKDKRLILHAHNRYRMFVANGLESRGINGGQPTASNMLQMVSHID